MFLQLVGQGNAWLVNDYPTVASTKKHHENRKTLPFERRIGCQRVKLFLLKDVTVTTITTVTITTVTITTITITDVFITTVAMTT